MSDYRLPVELFGINMWTLYPLLIIATALVVFTIIALVVIRIVRKRRAKRQQAERRYREAKALAKGIINAHLDYNNTLRAVDDATIEAFEAIIEEIAKARHDRPDSSIGRYGSKE